MVGASPSHASSSAGTRAARAAVLLLLAFSVFALVLSSPPPAHAASAIVQQDNGGCASGACPGTNTVSVAFGSGVTSGDVIVVGVADVPGNADHTLTSVTDSQLFSYTAGASICNGGAACAYVYYASASASGPDTMTASFTAVWAMISPSTSTSTRYRE